MSKLSLNPVIRLRGVRHNNLKHFDLDLPVNRLIVVTGLSGSGKSSLAFDTLFAEGQRRYIETFSPYARQFFDRMDKPQVDSIEGIPPAIAIEQRNAVRTTRSTIGTMTEICDFMKVLWPHVAELHCRQCGRPVRQDTPRDIWETLSKSEIRNPKSEWIVSFDLALSDKLSLEESLALVARQGYQRLLVGGQIVRLEEAASRLTPRVSPPAHLTVVQDRLRLHAEQRARFIEACEQAYHFGKGRLTVCPAAGPGAGAPRKFSNRRHCAECDIEYHEPTPALFSFNHPLGACPACRGFGRLISIDYDLAVPDRSKTLAEGVVRPWQSGHGVECQQDLMRACRQLEIPTDVPFERLPKRWQSFVVDGEPDYGKDEEHEWPRAWYGVKGYFRWLESRAYKMHVRVLLSRYRAYTTCPACRGARFQPETLLYRLAIDDLRFTRGGAQLATARGAPGTGPASRSRGPAGGADPVIGAPTCPGSSGAVPGCAPRGAFGPGSRSEAVSGVRLKCRLSLADFYALPVRDARALVEALIQSRPADRAARADPIELVWSEVHSRLAYLDEVGLGYLTLERPTRSLSGGETERVNLTTCLGTRLVNTLFVLDEPSVGLHPRDTERLVRILQQLRQAGNTVVVVEHEPGVMRAADRIVDLGPGHGATGGQVVFQGSFAEILQCRESITGQYLSGRRRVEIPDRRPVAAAPTSRPRRSGEPMVLHDSPVPLSKGRQSRGWLELSEVTRHNLHKLSVRIPIGRFVCVTGVSGSGKTTLVREVLLPALESQLKSRSSYSKDSGIKASERMDDRPAREPGAAGQNEGEDGNGSASATAGTPARLDGGDRLGRVVLVDQSILGKTPRSNPAVYIGAFDNIRECFAQSPAARQRGLNASAFSFNSAQGQCERCRGAGFEKIEMQFLSDVFIRCPDCNGRRYRQHILEVKIDGGGRREEGRGARVERGKRSARSAPLAPRPSAVSWSVADVLEATVDEVVDFLESLPASRPAQRALDGLRLLQEVGLGYLRLGQPINTLSGGESQRLKLVRHLAEAAAANPNAECRMPNADRDRPATLLHPSDSGGRMSDFKSTLFLFDEPTTGLHFDDVGLLLKVFQRLVDAGHSVLVIEHNLDVIKCADWIIDLGPGAGDEGGRIVSEGTPEDVAACAGSHTGMFLKDLLTPVPRPSRAAPKRRPDAAAASRSSSRSASKDGVVRDVRRARTTA